MIWWYGWITLNHMQELHVTFQFNTSINYIITMFFLTQNARILKQIVWWNLNVMIFKCGISSRVSPVDLRVRGCHRYIPLRMAGFCRGADDKSLGWMVDQGVWWMKLSVDQDDVFMWNVWLGNANFKQIPWIFSRFLVVDDVPLQFKKVSETSLPSFSADALLHDHWKRSRLDYPTIWIGH